jgi:putative transposase
LPGFLSIPRKKTSSFSVEDEFRIPEQAQCRRLGSLIAIAKTRINIEHFSGFSVTITIPMQRTFKHRIYPSHAQKTKLEQTLALCCELYNAALQERRQAYKISKISINYHAQATQLPEIKTIREDIRGVHSQVLQDVLKRLDKAFDAFFRRVKTSEKAGFPRFRSRFRYDSFTFPQTGFVLESGKLKLSKIGKVKIKLHRPLAGKIRTCTITKSATGKWYACFCVEVEAQPLPESKDRIGVDVGLNEFVVLSNGDVIHNPRFFRVEEKRLAKAQRRLSKAAKGTPERKKHRKVVAQIHERIANQRRDFAHQESRKLVNKFGIIVFEKLNLKGMLKNHRLAKSIADAAWNQLVEYTSYKAENAGRCAKQVNPRNTSQQCSRCGEIVKKDLSVRMHNCLGCGLVLDRDHNAAINILALGLQSLGQQTIEAASFR